MNTINTIHNQQSGQITRNSALRKAAVSADLPTLTKDESSLIKEKFSPNKKMDLYSMNGSVNNSRLYRGFNIDTRI